MHEDNNNSALNTREESIDDIIISILNKIWKGRKLIKNTIIIFFIIGCVKALLSPTVYESQTTFIPQTSDQNSSNNKGYAQLASLAGINLNAESISSLDNYISPLLYYKIAESDEFSLDMLNEELIFIDGSKSTVREYILSMTSNNILAKIIGFIMKYTIIFFKMAWEYDDWIILHTTNRVAIEKSIQNISIEWFIYI